MPWTAMHCPHITTARMYVVKEAQTPIFKSSDVAPQHHPPSFFRSLRFFQAGYEFRAPPARRRAFPAKFPLRVRSYVSPTWILPVHLAVPLGPAFFFLPRHTPPRR